MKRSFNLFILSLLGISLISCYPGKKATTEKYHEVRNVILMIGEGMKILKAYGFNK